MSHSALHAHLKIRPGQLELTKKHAEGFAVYAFLQGLETAAAVCSR